MTALLAALCAGLAAALLFGPRAVLASSDEGLTEPRQESAALLRLRPLVAPLAGAGAYLLLGGVLGLTAGGLATWSVWRILGATESPAVARRREQLERDLPTGVDLLAACVHSGAAVESALLTVADAIGGPLAEELRRVHHRLALGVDPVRAWQQLDVPVLQPLSRSVLRAYESGAAVTDAISLLADDMREQARTEVLVRANSVEVRAAAPLGVCFLPAFVLVGVVPLVAGTFAALRPFG